jgi:hypothetical protein
MVRGIPAAYREIKPADECDRIVDHDDLLVVSRTERQFVVKTQTHLPRCRPVKGEGRKQLPLQRVDDRIIPKQQVHGEIGAFAHQR